MIGAIEKQKLVYIVHRDTSDNLTISSPLQSNKANTITFDIAALDVFLGNPIFACLEINYSDIDTDSTGQAYEETEKMLTFYELELGMNSVNVKVSEPVDRFANMLIPIPGSATGSSIDWTNGPGGVIICSENFIEYRNMEGQKKVVSIPRRADMPKDKGLLLTSYAVHKQTDMFFVLVQSEYGDLYKITLVHDEDVVEALQIQYFDTVPVANTMSIQKSGHLFVGSEFGNHVFFRFSSIGDEDTDRIVSSEQDLEGEMPTFEPTALEHLESADELESLSPIMDFKVMDLAKEMTPQMYAMCGTGAKSSLRILRHGLSITEVASKDLPGTPTGIWSLKANQDAEMHKYIVISFVNATMTLQVDDRVRDVTDTGIQRLKPTLNVGLLGYDSIVQVHPEGLIHIQQKSDAVEWKCPGRKTIIASAINQAQVVICLSGGDLIYFELDQLGNLKEKDRRDLVNVDVSCLALGDVPEGRLRSQYLAVGANDGSVRIVSLKDDEGLQEVAIQVVPDAPTDLAIMEMAQNQMTLHIGLKNGVVVRAALDTVNGSLSDNRTRFTGSNPVRFGRVEIGSTKALASLSSRVWLSYIHHGKMQMNPVSTEPFEFVTSMNTSSCPDGIVAITDNIMRIMTLDRLGEQFNQVAVPLKYTPREFVVHPYVGTVAIIESDQNASNPDNLSSSSSSSNDGKGKEKVSNDMELDEEDEDEEEESFVLNTVKAGAGEWASMIRIMDPISLETRFSLELEDNEAAVSMAIGHLEGDEETVYLAVGCARDLSFAPRSCSGGVLHLYQFDMDGETLIKVHDTDLDGVPGALHIFQGRILAGVDRFVRVYAKGTHKCLKKSENKDIPNFVTTLTSMGNRIIIGDLNESFFYAVYKRSDNNSIYVFADDTAPRHITSSVMLDYDTNAGGDKFGNLFVTRLPSEVNEELDDDPMAAKLKWDAEDGASHKLEEAVQFHVGETILAMDKASLVPGGVEALIYTGLFGTIGGMLPFVSREDVDFFSHLEMLMRQENPPLCGRDHLSYRSYYFPVKAVVDGDLCEQFAQLPQDKQESIAEELDRTVQEVLKKMEDMRNRVV
eukprot:TRINITY_DN1616_c0_g1_i10.p1 TRINITY_DN1616_c0_g1~~TRINITY_DN1616_c0_g1_i10.p1  ORF type:complete len:1073 (-),score=445.40 TRINITY_DN1616_c0_g1_i10:154-3372(-)